MATLIDGNFLYFLPPKANLHTRTCDIYLIHVSKSSSSNNNKQTKEEKKTIHVLSCSFHCCCTLHNSDGTKEEKRTESMRKARKQATSLVQSANVSCVAHVTLVSSVACFYLLFTSHGEHGNKTTTTKYVYCDTS